MPKARITAERVRNLACPAGKSQAFLWDTDSPLGVRVTAGGAKAYIFQARLDGQSIRRTIGDAAGWTIDAARSEARRLRVLIDQGTDPRELDRAEAQRKADEAAQQDAERKAREAAEQEAAERGRYTLRALGDAYARLLDARGKARSAGDVRSSFRVHVHPHAIADKPARDVAPLDVAALVRRVAEAGKPRAAGILRSYLHAAYSAARRAPLAADLPAELIAFRVESNPVEIVPTIPVARGDRTLTADELRDYLGRLGDGLPDQALRLALYAGGQRMAQLLRATVADYDADTATLRLLDGKGKRTTPREHRIPLAPKGAAMVARLIERANTAAEKVPAGMDPIPPGQRWLFGVPGGVRMATDTPGKRLAEIVAEMKGEPFNLRDVRRTVETMLAGLGVSRDVRAQLLSHGLSGVQSAHYDRHEYAQEKRAALVAWENKIDPPDEAPAGGKVVKLKARTRRG